MRIRHSGITVILAAVIAVAAGCSDHGTDPAAPDRNTPTVISYAADIQPIWTANCIVCHGVGGNGGLDLRSPDSHGRLVGIAATGYVGVRIAADEPDQSVLYRKLTGAGGVGGFMPPTGMLGPTEIETVRRWIVEGALDN